ncbi:hypothetical protein JTP67_33350, partial [Streptomyces sp. S12]|nr:hypothetical protein [Streptomyces sp. S12]
MMSHYAQINFSYCGISERITEGINCDRTVVDWIVESECTPRVQAHHASYEAANSVVDDPVADARAVEHGIELLIDLATDHRAHRAGGDA